MITSTKRRTARITIGMMVHNESAYLQSTLDSLYRQDAEDFELIIIDNASDDGTQGICERFAGFDPRLRYVRNKRNTGAIASFSRLIEEASGEYFVLAAGHDQWSHNYLSVLRNRLDGDPSAVIAFGDTQWIDSDNQVLPIKSGVLDTSGMPELNRFLTVLWNNRNCLYGMLRLQALRKTSYARRSITMESVIMQQMAIQGSFAFAPTATWRRRIVRPAESANERLLRYYSSGFLFEQAKTPILPYWRIPAAMVETGLRASVPWRTRVLMAICGLTSVLFLRDELTSDLKCFPKRLLRYLRTVHAEFKQRRRPSEPIETKQSQGSPCIQGRKSETNHEESPDVESRSVGGDLPIGNSQELVDGVQ